MKTKRKSEKTFAYAVTTGVLVSIILSIMLAMGAAFLITNERIGEERLQACAWVIAAIAAFTGCFTAMKNYHSKIAWIGGITALSYLVLKIGTGILFFNGGFRNLFQSVLSIVIGYGISCAICISGKGRKRGRKSAYR